MGARLLQGRGAGALLWEACAVKRRGGRHSMGASGREGKEAAAPPLAQEAESSDGGATTTWVSLPQELLRDVIARVETSDGEWPSRSSVVACAGVCKTWRSLTRYA